jgi:DUF971 family protein
MTQVGEDGDVEVEPTTIDVDRQTGVSLTWADGRQARFGLVQLRVNCPCAACLERRRAGQDIWPRSATPPPLTILDARLVGAFGIAFDWSDGHSTGIYNWEMLRRWSAGPLL